ncbi:antitoxin of toxin-antitoxin stability system [Labrys sp. LIt4]|uniref:Antitoxin of toxin-antitoxin stability system n=1 Tax=Labrys okinawensis TaxID=346911 RepID=A0A2S9QGM2_9HYPH|nr:MULTISPECIES: antitoxin of toxin-antitoxin stability system [Labrys]MBP0579351.1 antitoxin of toxin-antitoxin stability system [Labrys sp. LIt4]PRH88485.1 antitoxin of toxin-antitoxin stability system [Labrys okinawensis]
MSKETMFTLKLEPELRNAFMAEAEAAHRPASQVVRELMREFIERQQQAREHDAWFRSEVAQAMREADDPSVARISQDEVSNNWRRQRAQLVERAGGKSR